MIYKRILILRLEGKTFLYIYIYIYIYIYRGGGRARPLQGNLFFSLSLNNLYGLS
jgi:hypothetical protein